MGGVSPALFCVVDVRLLVSKVIGLFMFLRLFFAANKFRTFAGISRLATSSCFIISISLLQNILVHLLLLLSILFHAIFDSNRAVLR